MLYSFADRFLQELFIDNEYPPRGAIYQVYEFLRQHADDPIELTHAEIRETAGLDLNESAVGSILRILDKFGAIEKFLPRENMAIVRINIEPDETGAGPSLVDRLGPQAHVQRTVLLGLEGLVRGRLGEPVYFRPDELAAALGLDRPALNRAIHSLIGDLPIDYVPPFRGNAIRVIDRTRKARDLQIDFATLEKRKQHGYDKLERMIQYARNTQCRRSYILNYFGERTSGASSCRSCDNCRPGTDSLFAAPAVAPIDTPRGRELLLKVLSGVARAKGRFGKVAVVQMLTGSDSERMSKGKLDQLSTYGILRDSGFTRKDLTDIIDALTRIKLIETQDVDRYKPVVTLSDQGWRWLRGQDAPDLVLDLPEDLVERIRRGGLVSHRPAPAKVEPAGRTEPLPAIAVLPESDSPDPGDLAGDPLWERLRSLRTDWARELKQPAYCIFTNQILEALVRQRPMTPAALAAIKGLGRAPHRAPRLGTTGSHLQSSAHSGRSGSGGRVGAANRE